MPFNTIHKIEKYQFYIDLAFSSATKKAEAMKSKHFKLPREDILRKVELTRIGAVNRCLSRQMNSIGSSFPQLMKLTPFYFELVKCTMDVGILKKSLAALDWFTHKADEFTFRYTNLVNRTSDVNKMMEFRREYYGRISSLLKQIKDVLVYLEDCRRIFRQFPVVKTMPTAAICGFPNIGKTTLLSKLTASTPEIATYPFTTKQLNIGYMPLGDKRVQLIDTPGTLNRFEKMNNIEKQAHLAVKYCADMIIYIYDLSEPYPLRDQHALFETFKEFSKPIIIYLSKTDILPKEIVQDFKRDKEILTDPSQIKKEIAEFFKDKV